MLNQRMTQTPPPTPKRRRAPLTEKKIDRWDQELKTIETAKKLIEQTSEWRLKSKSSDSLDKMLKSLMDTAFEAISMKEEVEEIEQVQGKKEKEKEKEKESETEENIVYEKIEHCALNLLEEYFLENVEEYFQSLINSKISSSVDSPIKKVEKILNVLESGNKEGSIEKRATGFFKENFSHIKHIMMERSFLGNRQLLLKEIEKLSLDTNLSSDEKEAKLEEIKRLFLNCIEDEKQKGEKLVDSAIRVLDGGSEKALGNLEKFLSDEKKEFSQKSEVIGRASLSVSEVVSEALEETATVLFGTCRSEAKRFFRKDELHHRKAIKMNVV